MKKKKSPEEGYPLRHNEPDSLNGITPEMREAAKPKLKGINFKAPVIAGTTVGYILDEVGHFSVEPLNWKNIKEFKPSKMDGPDSISKGIADQIKHGKVAPKTNKSGITLEDLEEAARYIYENNIPKIDLIIYQAEGYFVGEYVMEGRSGKTKAGWKGIKEFVERYSPSDFKVAYNGVKYKVEDNKELFKKLFNE